MSWFITLQCNCKVLESNCEAAVIYQCPLYLASRWTINNGGEWKYSNWKTKRESTVAKRKGGIRTHNINRFLPERVLPSTLIDKKEFSKSSMHPKCTPIESFLKCGVRKPCSRGCYHQLSLIFNASCTPNCTPNDVFGFSFVLKGIWREKIDEKQLKWAKNS